MNVTAEQLINQVYYNYQVSQYNYQNITTLVNQTGQMSNQISNLGRLKRKIGVQAKKERILKQIDNGNGYKCVCLSKNGKIFF